MASKLIDVYMKFVAGEYLEVVLGEPLRDFIKSKKSCEVQVFMVPFSNA
jgi:hypothetical protein